MSTWTIKLDPNLIPRFNIDYGLRDLIDSIKSIYSSKKANFKVLRKIFPDTKFFFTNSGRTSLYVILKSLDLPEGSNIGIPLYSCTSIFDSIIKAGHTPAFIDIDLENYTMDPSDLQKKIDGLSAIIVIHTFGRPADIDEIKKVSKDIPIIEDCAHSLLSDYKGKITGSMGDMSFFSFRSRKYISAGEGGMILVNNSSYLGSLMEKICCLESNKISDEIKHSLSTYTISFLYHRPWYGLFVFPIGYFMRSMSEMKIKNNINNNNIRKSDYAIFRKKLEIFKENMELQREKSKFLLEGLRNTSLKLPFEKKNTKSNYYLFPILFNHKNDRDSMWKYLQKNGIDSAKLWSSTPKISRQFYGYQGDCPNSEKCADSILTIPNYYTLDKRQLNYIIHHIKKKDEEFA